MKFVMVVLVSLLLVSSVFANGLSLNSIGTRALGMGGAYVGLASDPTAVYWNPAGLSGQNSSLMVFATDIIPFATYQTPDGTPAAFAVDAETKANHYIGPNLFAAYNMGDLTLGLGAYVPAGLGAEWDKADFGHEYMSQIGVFNFSPAISYRLSDQLSVGLAVNIYYGMMEMKRGVDDGSGTGAMVQYSEEISGLGFGAALGVKYLVNDQLSLGLSFKTPINVAFEGDATSGALEMDVERDIEWPVWVGFGAGYKVNEKLTIAADAQYSMWSSLDKLTTKSSFTHPSAGPMEVDEVTHLKWEDAIQFRLGAEYMMSECIALRGGYYYDPAPSPDETLVILFPSSTNHVLTGGATYYMDNLAFDFSLEYLLGAERDIALEYVNPADPTQGTTNAQPGIHQMDVFAFSLGFSYGF